MLKIALSLRWLRWVLLALYLGLVLSLGSTAFIDLRSAIPFAVLVTLGFQALFIFGSGKLELNRPIRGWRLAIPAAVAGLMLAILIGGASLALLELFRLYEHILVFWRWMALMGVSWIVWSFLLFVYCQGWERFNIIGRLTGLIFAGSLATLLVSIPAHIIVSRRPGCFVGLFTALGIASGIYVMLWSFGPAILLLFFREKRRFELREDRRPAVDPAPEAREQPRPPKE
ncbi:MAG: hypothetical protein IH870_01525 [Chloroflexi bacterium]|nr:hypothetical protein [Chloroflexota bacterium]